MTQPDDSRTVVAEVTVGRAANTEPTTQECDDEQRELPYEELTAETRDMHRALESLMEELEAVDWYNQRVQVTTDEELRGLLIHNRDEEKEHAAMVLEWIRRKDAVFSKELKEFLFTDKPIAHE